MKWQFEEKVTKLTDQVKYAEVKEREVRLEEIEERLKRKEMSLEEKFEKEKKDIEAQYEKLREAYWEKVKKGTDAEIEKFEREIAKEYEIWAKA